MAKHLGFVSLAILSLTAGLVIGRSRLAAQPAAGVAREADSSDVAMDELLRNQRLSAVAIGNLSTQLETLRKAVDRDGPAPSPAPATAAPEADLEAQEEAAVQKKARVETARAVISAAVSSGGAWRTEDKLRFRQALESIGGPETAEVFHELVVALNTGKLKPTLDDGLGPL